MSPLAFACFLLAAVETAAIGRTFAAKYDRRLDANQEFLALGASNLAAGFGQGFPVSGGMSQSVVNEGGGARTPLSGAIAAVFILVVVLFFSQLLSALPQPVLAAVVLVAVASLVSLSALRHLWRSDGREFVIAMVAMFGVLGQGLLRGVAIGAVISLVLLIRRASLPPVASLGRIPGTRRFSDRERHPENETIPGMLILRPGASLLIHRRKPSQTAADEAVRSGPNGSYRAADWRTSHRRRRGRDDAAVGGHVALLARPGRGRPCVVQAWQARDVPPCRRIEKWLEEAR